MQGTSTTELRKTLQNKIGILVTKYTGTVEAVRRSLQEYKIAKGLGACQQLEGLLDEVTQSMGEAEEGLRQVDSLSKRGSIEVSSLKQTAPAAYRLMTRGGFEERKGWADVIPFRFLGGKSTTISTDKALSYIASGLEALPGYVDTVANQVEQSYGLILQLRQEIYTKVNEINDSRRRVGPALKIMEETIQAVEARYQGLEAERRGKSERGEDVGVDVLNELKEAENYLAGLKLEYQKGRVLYEEGINLVELLNSQVGKLGESEKLAENTLLVMRKAQAYVHTQVPYALVELQGQRSMTLALGAIEIVNTFLAREAETARKYNQVLHEGVEGSQKSLGVSMGVATSPHILPEGGKVKPLL